MPGYVSVKLLIIKGNEKFPKQSEKKSKTVYTGKQQCENY